MKRKATYEQALALDRGHQVARANQRRRVGARQAAEAAADRERQAHLDRGVHGWKNWEYADDYKTETRVCRDCGATETREVRL